MFSMLAKLKEIGDDPKTLENVAAIGEAALRIPDRLDRILAVLERSETHLMGIASFLRAGANGPPSDLDAFTLAYESLQTSLDLGDKTDGR